MGASGSATVIGRTVEARKQACIPQRVPLTGRLWVASIGKPQSKGYLAPRAPIGRFFPFSVGDPF